MKNTFFKLVLLFSACCCFAAASTAQEISADNHAIILSLMKAAQSEETESLAKTLKEPETVLVILKDSKSDTLYTHLTKEGMAQELPKMPKSTTGNKVMDDMLKMFTIKEEFRPALIDIANEITRKSN